ncbi:MAG: hypothetical protein MUO85_00420, partial [candidate division Zixibacteria bacterium]|nr:hypothetical protein [candidate division Zixibacteria bacterium]
KDNLRYAIIPAIRTEDRVLLEKVRKIMVLFNKKSKTFSIDDLKLVNQEIHDTIPLRKPLSQGYKAKITLFFKSHKYAKALLAMASIGVGCGFFSFLLIFYEVPKEYAVTAAVALFGILVGAYLKLQGVKDESALP